MEENTLEQFHKQQNFNNMEGHSGQCFEEHQFLSKLIQEHKDITDLRILEIGFNAGNSSDNFLSSHPTCKVVSFDIGEYNYVLKCKEYIDAKYPGRHQLILGDSTKTVPEYQGEPFDIIFIDGGHEGNIPEADLRNCQRFSKVNSILIMDDVKTEKLNSYNIMPTYAWELLQQEGKIVQSEIFNFSDTHGLAYGKYN